MAIEDFKERKKNEGKIKYEGGDVFRQLEARLRDTETGKLNEDIVIYALRTIKPDESQRAKSFLRGYIENIRTNPEKYPVQAANGPVDYVIGDIMLALNLHFRSEKTHEFWNEVIEGYTDY